MSESTRPTFARAAVVFDWDDYSEGADLRAALRLAVRGVACRIAIRALPTRA